MDPIRKIGAKGAKELTLCLLLKIGIFSLSSSSISAMQSKEGHKIGPKSPNRAVHLPFRSPKATLSGQALCPSDLKRSSG